MATTKTKSKKKSPVVNVVFSTFDSSYNRPAYREIRSSVIGKWKPITFDDYSPTGGTPLLDATAKFIGHLDSLKKKGSVVIGCMADESGSMGGNEQAVIDGINEFVSGMKDIDNIDPDSDGKILAVIFTDGDENSSVEVNHEQLAKMIKDREKEDWTFIYLGANQDAWSTGNSYGFQGNANTRTINFVSSPEGTRSGIRYAGLQASELLSNTSEYEANAVLDAVGSLTEDGTWKGKNK